jgi:hypothetical protein
MICRHCQSEITKVFVDLNYAPISNAMLGSNQLRLPECYYPLKVLICENCFLVQVEENSASDKFFNEEYTYFSSYSSSWLAHSKKYVDYMMNRFGFNESSLVMEIASNDGYLLQYFKDYRIPVLGIEPSANTAGEAIKKGIETRVDFFTSSFVEKQLIPTGTLADLIIGNNVLAHVPDINDFIKGMKIALKECGVITMEFPHLMKLITFCQFDTIYHEHYSYLSFYIVKKLFEQQGLEIFDVEELPTHGGSLRIFAKHKEDQSREINTNVIDLYKKEILAGVNTIFYYDDFQSRVDEIKFKALSFLIEQWYNKKKIAGYGAAAKGNTLINYLGIKGNDIIRFVADASPYKQSKFMPGSHIPVVSPDEILNFKPDYLIIFPWNLKDEIQEQFSFIKDWGGKFVIFVPDLEIT